MADREDKRRTDMPAALSGHIPYRLGMLTNLIRQATTDVYVKQSEISGREWRVLAMVGIVGPMLAREVVDLTGMDKATITRAVTRLCKLDLMRQDPSPDDKRAKLLSLNGRGEALCARIIPQMLEGGDHMADALTAEERKVFLSCLDKLTNCAQGLLEESRKN